MKKLIGLFCLVLFLGCQKEKKEPQPAVVQEHLVTGFNYTDFYGMPIGKAGEPNVKTSFQKDGNNAGLYIYPNPVADQMAIRMASSIPHTKKVVWIVAAPQSSDLDSYNFPKANAALIGGAPVYQHESELGYQTEEFIVDFKALPDGAYRIYAKFDDELLWDNILKGR